MKYVTIGGYDANTFISFNINITNEYCTHILDRVILNLTLKKIVGVVLPSENIPNKNWEIVMLF